MKIKKIKKVRNFGTFDNFQWQSSCQEFEQYNFFYGWNYSGKTTLSRIFRCLETKTQHPDFPNAEFSLETDNGNITQRSISKDYPIRIFNEEFVEDNFQWNSEIAEIEPVLILGKEIKDLEIMAEKLQKDKKKKEKILEESEEKEKRIERELNDSLTDKATEVRNILKITNPREFDKNKLEDRIKIIKDSYQKYIILPDDEKEKVRNLYESKKPDEVTFEYPPLKFSTYISEVKNILSQKVTAQQIIEKLKTYPKLSDWVKEGIELHQNEKVCQFCGNLLPSDLFERLNKHFSHGFDNLMKQINCKEDEILNHIKEIKNISFPDKARLFENMQNEYESKLNNLTTLKNGYIQILQDLNKELNRKKESPFDSLEQRELLDNTTKLENVIKEIKTNIDTHNLKVDSFEIEKQKAKVKLINHFTAEFIINKDYFKIQSEIKKNNNNIQTLRPEIDTLVEEIKNINSQIKKEAIGADKINEYLKQFFNDGKLKVQLTENSKYKLYRNNQIAKNLSTGEKNIISLIYFFAKLEETDFNFNNAVIFLDDPVSSLDNNHIFKVYAFINEKLKDCKQFFITTHNFDFFNLLKDLSRYDLKNKGNFYLVKKIKNQTGEFSCIENLPNILLCFKSEYNYLFSILKSFNEIDDKSNFELLYLLPNVVRRFFEAYLFMKYPDGKKFDSKAKTFLKDTNISNKQNILKLIDEYSHEENPEHSQKFPDIEEVENAVSFILETIEEKDKEHYKALCESLKNNSN